MPNPARTLLPLAFLLLLALAACEKPRAPGGAEPRPGEIVTRSGVEMIFLPGGAFTMGTSDGNADEAPEHKVSISPLLMDKYPVTHEMFAQAQLSDPSRWHDNPKKPVERVRWRDAKNYCNERSLLEGLRPCYDEKSPDWPCDYSAGGYRLPTEAEWEYAARGGAEGPYEFGPVQNLRQYGWYAENSERKTHPVGQKKPTGWGLHDMYGNVSQWCEDVYSPSYYQSSPAADPRGPPSAGRGAKRVLRGGNWKSSAEACRATYRQGERTGDSDACFNTDYCGFRCVRRASPAELSKLTEPRQTGD